MGLHLTVYRNPKYDCTMGGITSKYDTLTVINAEGPFEPTDDAPAVELVKHVGTVHLKPVERDPGKWYCMGGNYAGTSDSRFGKAIEKMLGHRFYGAVAVHDRAEG